MDPRARESRVPWVGVRVRVIVIVRTVQKRINHRLRPKLQVTSLVLLVSAHCVVHINTGVMSERVGISIRVLYDHI